MRNIWVVWFVALLYSASASAQDIEAFEAELDETIKAACHGYLPDMLPDAVSWLRDQIYENSTLCERAASTDDLQFKAYVREIRRGGPPLNLQERDDSNIRHAMECDNEYMCIAIRGRLYRAGDSISQADYNRVSNRCDGRYACIEAFFLDWPRPLPPPVHTVSPSDVNSGISLASLRKKPESVAFPSTSTATANVTATADGISLGSVFSERNRVEFEEGIRDLKTMNLRLGDRCLCSERSQACFDNPYGPVKDQIAQLESQRQAQCSQWKQQFAGRSPLNQAELGQLLSGVGGVIDQLDQIDQQAESTIAKAASDYRRLVAKVEKQKQEESSFQWGKLAALGVGAVAGGISELETSDQIEFIGAMVVDSKGGSEGIGNMQAKAGGAGAGSMASSAGGVSPGGSYSLACNLPQQSVCVEYTVDNQQKYDQYKAQCRSTGATILARCEVSGPACTQTNGSLKSVTISTAKNTSTVQSQCRATGGIYSLR